MLSLPYYSLYPKDFECDEKVRRMGMLECGLFVWLLNHAWINDGLPADPVEVQRMLRGTVTEFRRAWPSVEPCFPISEDGRRRNPRQEEERAKAVAISEKARKSIRKRWERNTVVSISNGLGNTRASHSESVSESQRGSAEGDFENEPVSTIAKWLRQYGEHVGVGLNPDHAMCFRLCRSMMQANKTLDDFEKILQGFIAEGKKPKSLGWLITVIEARFGGAYVAGSTGN